MAPLQSFLEKVRFSYLGIVVRVFLGVFILIVKSSYIVIGCGGRLGSSSTTNLEQQSKAGCKGEWVNGSVDYR